MKTTHSFKFLLTMLAASVVFCMASCKKISYHQLTDEEMLWLHYKNNEILTFTNGAGEITEFKTVIRLKAYIDRGEESDEWTGATVRQLNDTTAITSGDSEGQLYIIKTASGLSVTMGWPHFIFKEVPLTNKLPVAANIGGINYTDIYIMNSQGFADNRFYNTKVWVSKNFGVVQYEDIYGKTWVRDFI